MSNVELLYGLVLIIALVGSAIAVVQKYRAMDKIMSESVKACNTELIKNARLEETLKSTYLLLDEQVQKCNFLLDEKNEAVAYAEKIYAEGEIVLKAYNKIFDRLKQLPDEQRTVMCNFLGVEVISE